MSPPRPGSVLALVLETGVPGNSDTQVSTTLRLKEAMSQLCCEANLPQTSLLTLAWGRPSRLPGMSGAWAVSDGLTRTQVRPSAGGWGLSSRLAKVVHTVVGPEFPAIREDGPALKCFHAPDPVAWASHVAEGPTGGEGRRPAGPAADAKGLASFPRPSIHSPPPLPPLRGPPGQSF